MASAALKIERRGSAVHIILEYDNEPDAILTYHAAQSMRLDDGFIFIEDDARGEPYGEPVFDGLPGLK